VYEFDPTSNSRFKKDSSLRNGSLDSIKQAVKLEGSSNMPVEKDHAEITVIDGTRSPLEISPAPLTSELIGDTPIPELDGSPVSKSRKQIEKN